MNSMQHRFVSIIASLFAAVSLTAVSCGPRITTGPSVVDPDADTEFTETESGLKYRILRRGNGNFPTANSTVKVDYTGKLDDGTTFDSSYDHQKPAEFGLNGVIAGWTEGVPLISVGGMIELEVPPELGYGEEGTAGIPGNSTLHFRVELLDIL